MCGTHTNITESRALQEEMARRNAELEHFNRAATDRELRMIALKREVNALSRELGREPPYDLSFADDDPDTVGERDAP
jgi:hypothetical protein